ncbi:helix-turn-helix domain-containing protein [Streptomyces lavendulae]|uniref:AlbA family DNA-binding domain-containing protein n=1 Tax=Streptomyces lavendulae TaxID=1914 RepID=UPI0036816628
MPIYLSPEVPGWSPRTEADLQAAIDSGLLEESHRLDLKQALHATKGDNKELARDIASFAVDGGTLIIGIGEDKENRTFFLAPQPLKGLGEKVEQVARTLPDPPLTVVTKDIPATEGDTEGGEERGYLVIHVPASPAAPHMVDGRYHGRGDKTKHVLSDADVVRLHERRRSTDQDALELLQHEMDRDPVRHGNNAHLFLLAQPLASPRDMLLRLTGDPQWGQRLNEFIAKANTRALNEVLYPNHDIVPSLAGDASRSYRRARGIAAASPDIGPARLFTSDGSGTRQTMRAIELQVGDDGGLRIYSSRLSDEVNGQQQIFAAAPVVKTRRLLALVVAAAEEAGYFGNWALAVGANRLKGKGAYNSNYGMFGPNAQYDADIYAETTTATWAELTTTPGAITRRLTGSLLRALGVEQHFDKALSDPAPEQSE